MSNRDTCTSDFSVEMIEGAPRGGGSISPMYQRFDKFEFRTVGIASHHVDIFKLTLASVVSCSTIKIKKKL